MEVLAVESAPMEIERTKSPTWLHLGTALLLLPLLPLLAGCPKSDNGGVPSAEDWTPDNGMLTPTLKLKRKIVVDKYMPILLSLYK